MSAGSVPGAPRCARFSTRAHSARPIGRSGSFLEHRARGYLYHSAHDPERRTTDERTRTRTDRRQPRGRRPPLFSAVGKRAHAGPCRFHLVVPATPRGLHRVADPEVAGRQEAEASIELAVPLLSEAAGSPVAAEVGSADPVAATHDAMHARGFDEVMVSTLPRPSRAGCTWTCAARSGTWGRPSSTSRLTRPTS
jgi:hypothetical protein